MADRDLPAESIGPTKPTVPVDPTALTVPTVPTVLTWPGLITQALAGDDLTRDQAAWAMDQVMSGAAPPASLAGVLVALRAKGESVAELRGLADTMLLHARRWDPGVPALDIVGTGGDRSNTVNISTMACVVASAAGVPVVKHGNRAASSASGAADVLEALGVRLDLDPGQVQSTFDEAGITFCFAQAFHPAFRHAAAVRRELGIPTAFNVLGPLTNPAQPRYAAVGVADARMAPLIAGVFAERGARAVVFRGDDGLDELSPATTSRVWWVAGGVVREFVLDPRELGIPRYEVADLRGGDAAHNADVVRAVFDGASGAVRDVVTLNAGIALARARAEELSGSPQDVVGPQDAVQLHDAIRAGINRARQAIDSGAAAQTLQRWVQASRQAADS